MSFGNIRFVVVFLLSIATIFSSTHGLVDANELSKVEEEFLKKNCPLIFVSQTNYPPFEFLGSDGDHTGMCIDLVRWIATEFGFKVNFIDTSFKQAQDDVLSEKAHILTSLFYSEKRDKVFDFTKTIFTVPASIFVMAERPDIKDINDLQGKIIAMQSGDYAQEFLELKGIKCSYKYTTDFAEATDLVIADKADAIIGDEQIVLYHIFSTELTDRIKKVGEPLYIGQNCMGAKDPNPILIGIINKGIELAQNKGVLDQIYKKWIGTRYSPQLSWMQQFFPYFFYLMGGIFLVVILVWVWNIKLRQTVLNKTAELSKSEETLRTILNASPLGIGIAQGRILGWHNVAMSRMLGYPQGELEGQDIKVLYQGNHHLEQAGYWSKDPVQQNSIKSVETQWIRKDGSVFPCQLRSAPVRLEDDKSMTITIAEDITERKWAEKELIKSELRYRTLVNTMQEGLLEVDADWHITFANERFIQISGYDRDNLIGMCFHDLVSKEYLSDAQKQHCFRQQGKTSLYELELVRSDGKKIFVRCSPNPSYGPEGKYLGGFGVISDITELKNASEEKEKLIVELKEAFANVKTLKGLLPICSSCKKIRDDKGYWNRIEGYIQKHSEALFTHSICPECTEQLYGKESWYLDMKKDKKD